MKIQKGDDFMENKKLIKKAISFIQANPKENLSLQNIADNAGFSLNYFDALFQKHTGYSPVEYSRIYKLTRSALALRRTEKSVLDIALDYGYASPESFARAFKNFYSISPSEYRTKYSSKPITWHDLSGKIAISRFRNSVPELKVVDIDAALDYCFTHNPMKYAEDIINMTVAQVEILTLGNTDELEHFLCVSDYNRAEPIIDIICDNEKDAIEYLKLLAKLSDLSFTIHKSIDCDWESFDAEIARLGLTCRYGYDMIYPHKTISVPEYKGMTVRELFVEDMSYINEFRQKGGCADCHLAALKIHFENKGNMGIRPFGLFIDEEMVCLAMPTLDSIRELKKYDIGGIFTLNTTEKSIELIWKHIISTCLCEGTIIGNSNAKETDSPLGVSTCESIGLIKVAKNCTYSK